MNQWQQLADRLQQHGVEFVIEPYLRFQGEVGEQATMFLLDNLLVIFNTTQLANS
jgi:uncharacterized protein